MKSWIARRRHHMSGQGTGKTDLWSYSRLKSFTWLPSSRQAEVNITTVQNPFFHPSACEPGDYSLLASVNSLHPTIKMAFMQSVKLRWLSWKERGINPFVIHRLYEESQKRKNLPYCPHKNSPNTMWRVQLFSCWLCCRTPSVTHEKVWV